MANSPLVPRLSIIIGISIFWFLVLPESEARNQIKHSHSTSTANLIQLDPTELIHELVNRGARPEFANHFFNHRFARFNPEYVKSNVLGFQKKDDYSLSFKPEAIEKVQDFIRSHGSLLNDAAKKYLVEKEVIAALLFIETRYGKNTGSHLLVSVFASQAHSNDPEILANTLKAARPEHREEDEEKIRKQAQRKRNRALREILALEKMQYEHKTNIYQLKGSYSGAFGWPQFLPSSYIQWAATPRRTPHIDLSKSEDAIFSVARYLHTQGFNDSLESKRAAVFHYNNSDEYVDAVLKLAGLAKSSR